MRFNLFILPNSMGAWAHSPVSSTSLSSAPLCHSLRFFDSCMPEETLTYMERMNWLYMVTLFCCGSLYFLHTPLSG